MSTAIPHFIWSLGFMEALKEKHKMTISCIKIVIHHLEHLPMLFGYSVAKEIQIAKTITAIILHFASTQREIFFRKFAYIKDNYTEVSTKLCTKAQQPFLNILNNFKGLFDLRKYKK